jgi:hypothetical protein
MECRDNYIKMNIMRLKTTILLAALLFLSARMNAQNVDDALRYSQIFYGGTARFMSMGGAFTALGADLSALSQNPAGIGVFRSSEISLSPQLFHIKTSADFNGTTTDYLYNFNLSQAGIVSNIRSKEGNDGLISLNIGYSFNKTSNLNQNIWIQGISNTSSMADHWALDGKGHLSEDLPSTDWLAYRTCLIDTLTGSGGREYGTVFSWYGDDLPSIYGQTVRRLISNEGYTGEHAFSFGGNYSNKIYFGATLGITKLNYTSHYEHLESTDVNLSSQFKNFTYTDHYNNTGTGVSLKIGTIIKPVESLRIGLAFHSPVVYHIRESWYEDMTSNFTDGGHYEYYGDEYKYSYALTTPFRVLAGVAFQMEKFLILSADYEFIDYSTAKFSETGDGFDYSDKNHDIKSTLKSAGNFRLGGELRLDKIYLRSGYGYYGSAFRSGDQNANLDYRSISFGAGFRERNVSIDFGYTNYKYSQTNDLYPLDDTFRPATVGLNTLKNMFTVTLGYKFGY